MGRASERLGRASERWGERGRRGTQARLRAVTNWTLPSSRLALALPPLSCLPARARVVCGVQFLCVSRSHVLPMFDMMVPRCNAGKPLLRVQCSQVPAGHSTWPVHSHSLAEEAVFVLAGTGVLKTPAGTRVRLEPQRVEYLRVGLLAPAVPYCTVRCS